MNMKKNSMVVIPAYKPGKELVKTVREVTDAGYRVLIVDDGSGDGYWDIWEEIAHIKRVRVIRHIENRGKGAALKTAFGYIADHFPGTGYIVTMDADGQHLTEDMERVLAAAWEEPGKLILGVRTFGKDTPVKSLIGNKATRLVFKAVSGTEVSDTQTGLRAFGRQYLRELMSIDGDRYEYEMNVLMYCGKNGIGMTEVPISTVYHDKKNSVSHFDPIRDAGRIYGTIIRAALPGEATFDAVFARVRNMAGFAGSSFISFVTDYLMFMILVPVMAGHAYGVLIANAAARVISAGLNYTVNSKAIFRDGRPVRETLPKYIALAVVILAANTLILTTLVNGIGLAPGAAKILTEIILFAVSYTIQLLVIFRPDEAETDSYPSVAESADTFDEKSGIRESVIQIREAA